MRRIQFIEIHEQPWFPSYLRDDVTDALQHGLDLLKAYAPISSMLQAALESQESTSIVDLCSGGGGPWLDLCKNLVGNANAYANQIWLSDKSPNLRAFENVRTSSGDRIGFRSEPVDAMNVPHELAGFRTIFSSYHHFSPEQARAVLQDAVDAGESIGIFEVTRRTASTIGLMFPWALLAFLSAPWVRPFRWSRLFWTYVVPIVPFVVLFDGVVSCLRTYQPQELREIIGNLTGSEYEWQVGLRFGPWGNVPVSYLIGFPRFHG